MDSGDQVLGAGGARQLAEVFDPSVVREVRL